MHSPGSLVGPRPRYDAFISYSHASDESVVRALQLGLERFSCPWYKARVLRVFRDRTNLSASPGLWPSIEGALSSSSWLIVIASPASARFAWVGREIAWWLANRDARRILLVLTEGNIVWNAGPPQGWDAAASNALPPALMALREEPFWQDLRRFQAQNMIDQDDPALQDCVARLAATLQRRPLDELVGEHVRQRRLVRRLVRGVIAVLSVLLLVATVSTVVAVQQRDQATTQARLATARSLAASSQSLASRQFDTALLLAVAAYRLNPDAVSRASLFQAAAANPHLVRYLHAPAPITSMAGSADGNIAVVGTQDGRVLRWDVHSGAQVDVATMHNPVVHVSASADGGVITASDGTTATVWGPAGSRDLVVPAGHKPGSVVVSPSGELVLLCSTDATWEPGTPGTGLLTSYASRDGRSVQVADGCGSGNLLIAPSNNEFVVWAGSGAWEKRSAANLRPRSSGQISVGVHGQALGVSDNGRYFMFSNGAPQVEAWRTDRAADPEPGETADFLINIPGSSRDALAISPDGTRMAVADAGTIYVTSLGGPAAEMVTLPGSDRIAKRGLHFFGDGDHLLSYTGSAVAVWDLNQNSRIGSTRPVAVPDSCNACSGPTLAANRDGSVIAALAGQAVLADSPYELSVTGPDWTVTPDGGIPLWSPDGRKLLLANPGRIDVRDASRPDLPQIGHWKNGSEVYVAMAFRNDSELAMVSSSGEVAIVDPNTGATRRSTTPIGRDIRAAAVDAQFAAIEYLQPGGDAEAGSVIRFVDLDSGAFHDVDEPIIAGMALNGSVLLTQRVDGSLALWDAGTRTRRWTLPAQNLTGSTSPAVSPDGRTAAVMREDGAAVLLDLATSTTLGEIRVLPDKLLGKVGMTFSGDGRSLIVGVEEIEPGSGRLQRWLVATDDLATAACRAANRNLSRAELDRYLPVKSMEPPGC